MGEVFVCINFVTYKIDIIIETNIDERITNMNQERYSRQMLFKHIGQEGHRKIENQHGLIIEWAHWVRTWQKG